LIKRNPTYEAFASFVLFADKKVLALICVF